MSVGAIIYIAAIVVVLGLIFWRLARSGDRPRGGYGPDDDLTAGGAGSLPADSHGSSDAPGDDDD